MPDLTRKTEKLYYSIGEVSEMLNVNPSLIRFWEKQFSAFRPKKNMSGTRHFTRKDIDLLQYIYHLVKVEGHTLEGANKIVKQKDKERDEKYKAIQSLEKIKNFLVDLRNEVE